MVGIVAHPSRHRGERLGAPLQPQFSPAPSPLERQPGAMHPLQHPYMAGGAAKFSPDRRHVGSQLASRGCQEIGKRRYQHGCLGLQPLERRAQGFEVLTRSVVIGADENAHVAGRSPAHKSVPHRRPRARQRRRIGGERCANLVAVGRQVVCPDLPAVGRAPAKNVARTPVATPDQPPLEPELACERGQRGWMPEGVGRVENTAAAAKLRRHGRTAKEVADQRLTRRHETIGQHPPRPGGQPLRSELGHNLLSPVGPHREVVINQRHLAVQEERCGDSGSGGVQPAVERLHQARQQPGAREVPLAVPVGV